MIANIEIKKIIPHPDNPRKNLGDLTELAESIKTSGILQNLTVVPEDPARYKKNLASKHAYAGNYITIIGHRRRAAAELAGLTEVPCTVTDMDAKTQIATMLLENMQRSDLTIIEQAQGFQMMMDLGETTQSIAEKTGFSETTVRRRLFVASLDAKKSTSAYERGATLDDYMKLQMITDEKKRNKVLETLGTNNFNYELENAIAEELRDRVSPGIIAKIEVFAKPTDKASWEIKGYGYHSRCGYEEYEKTGKLGFEIPAKYDPDEYLYHVSKRDVDIYKRQDNFKAEKKMSELPPAEQEERREHRRKYKGLKDAGEIAYRLRVDFVQSISLKPSLNAEQVEALSKFAFACVCLGDRFDFSHYASLVDIKIDGYMSYSQKRELKEKANAPAPRVLLMSLYSMLRDSAENTYYKGAEAAADVRGNHKQNNKLDAIYDCLCALGYQMSDEETALRDGSHELFQKEGQEGEP